MTRKFYLDNLRWMAILLLFPFHAVQIWSGGEQGGFYIWSHTDQVMYAFSTFVYPWYMTLFFTIAGCSLYFSLKKRTSKQVIKERVKKLLIPFVFGTLFLAPIMTYVGEIFFNGYTGSYFHQYILFFTKKTNLTGYHGGFTPGHLWFLIYLFFISLIVLQLIRFQKVRYPKISFGQLSYPTIVALFLPEWLMLYVLNVSGKSIGQFLFLFFVGYYILSEEEILEKIKRHRFVSLSVWLISGCLYVYIACFTQIKNELITGLYVFFGWMGILALFGIGQTMFNFVNSLSAYMNRASFPIYILHQPILVVVGYFTLKLQVHIAVQFLVIVTVSFIVTIILYEFIRRIPGLRFVLGIK